MWTVNNSESQNFLIMLVFPTNLTQLNLFFLAVGQKSKSETPNKTDQGSKVDKETGAPEEPKSRATASWRALC